MSGHEYITTKQCGFGVTRFVLPSSLSSFIRSAIFDKLFCFMDPNLSSTSTPTAGHRMKLSSSASVVIPSVILSA